MKQMFTKLTKAYTLMELMLGVAIIAFAAALSMITLSSLSQKKALQAEAEAVKEDMYLMQSRAVSGLRTQRFVIIDNSSYRLEEDSTGSGNWTTFQQARSFRTGIYFYNYAGKETKLWYESSGLPNFNGGSSSPFFSMIYNTTAEKKDFNIDSSGIVNIVTN